MHCVREIQYMLQKFYLIDLCYDTWSLLFNKHVTTKISPTKLDKKNYLGSLALHKYSTSHKHKIIVGLTYGHNGPHILSLYLSLYLCFKSLYPYETKGSNLTTNTMLSS